MSLRFFIPSADAQEPAHAGELVHVIDAFFWVREGAPPVEVVVVLDDANRVLVREAADPALSQKLRAELAYHEVTSGALRYVHATALHLFDLELVESAPPAPGVNDPLFAHGLLTGPFESPFETPRSQRGHFTLTRADLLEAFVLGAPHAFRYAGDATGRPPRCSHLFLGGDKADAVKEGRGAVLAYPLLPADVMFADASNDAFVAQTLYDVLAPMCTELGRDASTIPVPNRKALEQKLRAEGYELEGDVAIRRGDGVLGAMLGKLVAERVVLAQEATVEDYVGIAQAALAHVPGYPTEVHRALRARVTGTLTARVSPRVPAVPKRTDGGTPENSSFVRPPPSYRPPAGGKPDWMSDFVATDATPKPEKPKKKPADEEANPDWMDDFKKR